MVDGRTCAYASAPVEDETLPAGELTLSLLASPAKMALIEALPDAASPGCSEGSLLPTSVLAADTDVVQEVLELERLGLITRHDDRLRRGFGSEELLLAHGLLHEWAWGGKVPQPESESVPAGPSLAALVGKVWATDILVLMALGPATPSELAEMLPGYSLSTIKRYLRIGVKARMVERGRGEDGRRRSYSLTRRGMRLIRPLSAGLRLEERYLRRFAQPPSNEVLRAGMAVIARMLEFEPGVNREVIFEIVDEDKAPLATKCGRYRNGRLVDVSPWVHDGKLPCVRGTLAAWYDLIIDKQLGGMEAMGRGAKTVLRQIPRELRR